jgi:hypothetical protein
LLERFVVLPLETLSRLLARLDRIGAPGASTPRPRAVRPLARTEEIDA